MGSLQTPGVSVFCCLSLQCQICLAYYSCSLLLCVRAYFGIQIALKHILFGDLCYDVVKLLVELFNLLVIMV